MSTSIDSSSTSERNALISPPETSSWFRFSNVVDVTWRAGAAATNFLQNKISSVNTQIQQNSTSENRIHLTDAFNDLSSNLMRNVQQIKQIVQEKTILGTFTKEQDKFVQEKRTKLGQEDSPSPPWIGHPNEEMKNEILALSKDKRNFLRDPPQGADFQFDMAAASAVALATLEVDEHLRQMRFELVPKHVNEETFWRNYFYRVNLIQLNSLNSTKLVQNSINVKEKTPPVRQGSDVNETESLPSPEFVSDDYDTSAINIDEIQREIELLSSSSKSKKPTTDFDDFEWEKDLTDDLEHLSVEEIQAQINQMLENEKK